MAPLFHSVDRSDLKPGDHIYVWRSVNYAHHGIFIGDNEVIHFTGPCKERKREARVHRDSLDEFLQGGTLKRYEYDCSIVGVAAKLSGTCCVLKRDDPSDIVQRAKDFHEKQDYTETFGEYDALRNNCEMFALTCCLGEKMNPDSPTKRGVMPGPRQGMTGTPVLETVAYPYFALMRGASALGSYWSNK